MTTKYAEAAQARSRGTGPVVIAEIWNWGWAEHIKIENQGTTPQDLTGWAIGARKEGKVFLFPKGYVLKPGQTVTIHSGANATLKQNPPTDLYWNSEPIWANRGDTAYLFDASGNEVARYTYSVFGEPDLDDEPPQRLVLDETGYRFQPAEGSEQ